MLSDVLGLTTTQTLAYRELVGAPSLDADELSTRLGCEPADAYSVLRTLEEHGLVARQSADGTRFQAAPPEIALGALLARRSDEIRVAHAELSRLEEEYRRASALRPVTDVVDVVRGADAVRQRITQLQLGAREQVDAFVRPPVVVMEAEENSAEDQAVARGVRYRVVAERSLLDTGKLTVAAATTAVLAGEELRIAATVPLKLVIIDRRLAYLPLSTAVDAASAPETVGALLIHQGALLDALIALFDAAWRDATPFVVPGAGPADLDLDDQDLRILGLLLAGMTDQSVANQLDLSLRTVQRRVKVLMDLAGVSTRIQLGWAAARKGWL
ncbi:helix-turn-helix domain-containing protein [Antribacter gilvus]|uniref:helix-turn-helix domain-containing protein n=1 Tax=Antribacter gilvus TaxID=2304675 RepID=UPI000F7956AA|nr:helix-turn-helix domain-containing protein [Antribacter gilvus]